MQLFIQKHIIWRTDH